MEVVFVKNGLTKKNIAQQTQQMLDENKSFIYIAKKLNKSKYEILDNYLEYNPYSKLNKPNKKNILKLYRDNFSIEYICKIYNIDKEYIENITKNIELDKNKPKPSNQPKLQNKDSILSLYDDNIKVEISNSINEVIKDTKNFNQIEKKLGIDKYTLLVIYSEYYATYKNKNIDENIIKLHKIGFKNDQIITFLNVSKSQVIKVIDRYKKNKKSKNKKSSYKPKIYSSKKTPKDLEQYTDRKWVNSIVHNAVGTKK